MFNLLISWNSTAWETDQLMRIDAGRFKRYSGSESELIAADNPASLNALEGIPSLLLYERGAQGGSADKVHYGSLRDIRLVNGQLQFSFSEEGLFPRALINEYADRLGLSQWEWDETHWAIKDGGIPLAMLQRLQPNYDVVFSFAGEDREYVEVVAERLRAAGIKVFYDFFEEATLWGRNLVEHFDMVYRVSGRYCVIFISEQYVVKIWTRQERQFALARALQERAEYILPARFDSTEVPGIPASTAYIALAGRTPAELANLVLQKLGRAPAASLVPSVSLPDNATN